ncbi:MAG: GDSL-type esterase/lipase family protein [Deltaproteobacteria bacterium]|nr:GDSL-type esterase/lipase family protein [Deltaproteobacteria bacterium]
MKVWAFSLALFLMTLVVSPAIGYGETLVLLGDSLTFGGDKFVQIATKAKVFNLGVVGDTTMSLWGRLDEVVKLNPDRIYLQVGINDLGNNFSAEDIVQRHERIWAELTEKIPKVKIYVCSLIPVRESYFSHRPHRLSNAYIRVVNTELAKAAGKKGLPFIDLFTPLVGPDGELPQALTYDGVHITPLAYQVWLATLKPYLPEGVNHLDRPLDAEP